jgi:pyruvate/2-oxoglutarate dehydrogenase complex dihydrolipoamide acyltransferase (E2) component
MVSSRERHRSVSGQRLLAQLGITPEQFQKMTPKERAKVEDEIKELMKKDMQAQQQQLAQEQAAPTQQPGFEARTDASAKKHVSIGLEI